MNFKQLLELADKINFSREIDSMYNDMYELKKFWGFLLAISARVNSGDIAEAVNVRIEPLNKKYNTNFKCKNDKDYITTLDTFINYIDNNCMQKISEKIAQEMIRVLLNQ